MAYAFFVIITYTVLLMEKLQQYGYPIYYPPPIHPQAMMYYFPPMELLYPMPAQNPVKIEEDIDFKSIQFLKCFEEQLMKTSIKYKKKVWTKQQDNKLLALRSENLKWTQISEKIPDSNPQICKRRYQRLKQDEDKWPEEIQRQIKNVCSLPNVKWEQKMQMLYEKYPKIQSYSKKMIKQRYLTYLQERIQQRPWSIQEDLLLVQMLKKGLKRWKLIAQSIPGRTELHLKNRYYGCLRSVWKKVEKKMSKNL